MSANEKQVGGEHYKKMKIQVWDVIDTWPIEQQIGFYRGNVLKYTMRMGLKDIAVGEVGKAQHYAQKLLEVLAEAENHGEDEPEKTVLHIDMTSSDDFDEKFKVVDCGSANFTKRPESSKLGNASNVIRPAAEIPHVESVKQWTEDKELPSSGIYDDKGYTQEDMAAADVGLWVEHVGFEIPQTLNKERLILVKSKDNYDYGELHCNNVRWDYPANSIFRVTHWKYAEANSQCDADEWIEHVGDVCPVDGHRMVFVKGEQWEGPVSRSAYKFSWGKYFVSTDITHWKYAD